MDNIVQVLSFKDMDDIISKFDGIVIVLCTSKKHKYKTQKKNFFKDSVKAKDCMFVYIEQENFENKDIFSSEQFPLYIFFHSGRNVHSVHNHISDSILPIITYIRLLMKAIEEEELAKETNKVANQTSNKDISSPKSLQSPSVQKSENNENNEENKDPDILPEEKEEITKRLIETKKNIAELEQLESLVRLKKLKALQDFDNKDSQNSSKISSDSD